MEIFEAFDLTRCAPRPRWPGVDPKTVDRYVALRDGRQPVRAGAGPAIDPFLDKVEEWVDALREDPRRRGAPQAGRDGLHRDRALDEAGGRGGEGGVEAGHRRTYRPWVPEPGLWLQFDWGKGPDVGGREDLAVLCLAGLVAVPGGDPGLGLHGRDDCSANLDQVFRRLGGVPTFVLSDNAKTVTVEHVAGIPVRHPQMVALGRHYGCSVESCVPFDPESKGGVEATVKIAKWDLVPKAANLLPDYRSFAELAEACAVFCERVNGRPHRETGKAPSTGSRSSAKRCTGSRTSRSPWPSGDQRGSTTGRPSASARCATRRRRARRRQYVWCRVVGEELVVTADTAAGLSEIARHALSTPGNPRIGDEHYPHTPRRPVDPGPQAEAPHAGRDRVPASRAGR